MTGELQASARKDEPERPEGDEPIHRAQHPSEIHALTSPFDEAEEETRINHKRHCITKESRSTYISDRFLLLVEVGQTADIFRRRPPNGELSLPLENHF
jgi:hypothetical protein